MKNKDDWRPTKFLKTRRGYAASTDTQYVGIGSRLMAGILVKVYESAIKTHASGLLLDLGCGNVPLYDIYKDLITDNICVDWKNTLHKNHYIDYEFDLNEYIPLEDNKFDTILCTDVLEHIANPGLLINEIARLLRPNGKLILTVPFFYWLHEEPHDYFRYTKYSLQKYCINSGLNVLELKPYGGAPEVIMDIIAKNIAQFRMLSRLYLFFCRVTLKSYIGKKISESTCNKFPLGYCLIAQKPERYEPASP